MEVAELDRAALERAIAAVRDLAEPDPLRRVERARALLGDPGLATAAVGQLALRERAVAKFGPHAESMLFTSDGLEQASRLEVADHRAARYAAATRHEVLDLCSGIGADALAFQRAGLRVRAVDLDPATAGIAAANLAAAGGPAAFVEVGRAEDADWRNADSVFVDPARRNSRGRTFDPKAYSPDFGFVTELLRHGEFVAAKLGPGLDHSLIPATVEAEWVSFAGGVKEAVLWSAGFAGGQHTARPVGRRASILPAGLSLTDQDPAEPRVAEIDDYVIEPDGAVIRAGLVQQAAAALGAARIDEHLAYLTSDRPASTPLARSYRVIDVAPYSVKRLRAELRRREVGIVEIKTRGVDVDPARLRRELKPVGHSALTVILARVAEHHLAILAEPVRAAERVRAAELDA